MPWFSSTDDEPAHGTPWPPKLQSFEEYNAELNEAIEAHPPFGEWLRTYRNVKHLTAHTQQAMWELPVQQLKERYLESANLRNRTKNAKRAFIEMHLENNKATYEKDELERKPRLESYALARDSYNQAIGHGYRNIPRPKEPQKTEALCERDMLLEELKRLVDPTSLY